MYESSQDIGDTGGVHRTIAALVSIAALVVVAALAVVAALMSIAALVVVAALAVVAAISIADELHRCGVPARSEQLDQDRIVRSLRSPPRR